MNNGTATTRFSNQLPKQTLLRSLILGIVFAALGTFILSYRFLPNDLANLAQGSIVPRDIFAPRQIAYVSEVKTEQAHQEAKNAIDTIFSPPSPQVARNQVTRLQKIFDFIDTVKADPYGTRAQKAAWIRAIDDLTLSDTVIDQILTVNDQPWANTRQEAISVLNQALRAEIKEGQVIFTRRQLPNRVALDTPENQAGIIVALTEDLIRPNTFPDRERTVEAQQAAIESIEPVVVKIEPNEIIFPAGSKITTSEQVEKLRELGIQEPGFEWLRDILGPGVLMLLTTAVLSIYLLQYTPDIVISTKKITFFAGMVLIFLVIAKLIIPSPNISAHFYPIAALTMITASLINTQLAFIIAPIIAFLAGYMDVTEESTKIITYLILSGWAGALTLKNSRSISSLLLAGVHVGLVNMTVILVFTLTNQSSDFTFSMEIAPLLLEGVLNAIFSTGLALVGLISIGHLLGITTTMQLLDLARPTHPLLKQLLLKSPGTYHHSLMVSNLSEQAAERIGADALLVRVMAYYHDIGKMQRPYFFIENQPTGVNVHEKLGPKVSAQIIISHVTDGLILAKKYRLPEVIKEGIAQHHGTTLVKFFYFQAVKQANEKNATVNETDFRYPGPPPQNRENAILMLADVTESSVRAMKPGSAKEIDEIVQRIIADKLETGQLDYCDLTISDLHQIRTAFVDMLQGVHHPRINYPDDPTKKKKEKDLPAEKAS